jgi:signal transduction histidine kinase
MKTKTIAFALLTITLLIGVWQNSSAQGKATREECIDKCIQAVALIEKIGVESAMEKINAPESPLRWKDSYVYCFDTDDFKLLAHPIQRLIGRSMKEYRSADNILVFQEIAKSLANAKDGWITYKYLKPGETEPVLKTAFFVKVDKGKVVVVAGYYQ